MIEPGTSIAGRYIVDSVLGQGGMAVVYRVRHTQLGTWHALKVLTIPLLSVRERLLQEGRIQASASHPNIVAVTDVVGVDEQPGLVMELIRGPSLDRLLSDVRLSFDQCDELAAGIIDGVAAAHGKGLIHRDLKPANVLVAIVNGRMVPKVADFGLAKLLESSEHRTVTSTRTGMLMGTPAYMAPEQARDAKNVDVRADVFALGAILYEMVTGVSPFARDDLIDTINAVIGGDFDPPSELAPGLPERMELAILGALKTNREDRIPSCRALLAVWKGKQEEAASVDGVGPWSEKLLAQYDSGDEEIGVQAPLSWAKPATPPSPGQDTFAPLSVGPPDPGFGTRAPSTFSPSLSSAPPAMPVRGGAPRRSRGLVLAAVAVTAGLAALLVLAFPGFDTPSDVVPPQVSPAVAGPVAAGRAAGSVAAGSAEAPVAAPGVASSPAASAVTVGTRARPEKKSVAKTEAAEAAISVTPVPPMPVEAAAAEAAPPPPRTDARVQVAGDASRVWLQSTSGNFPLPADVTPGTYQIRAAFDGLEPLVVGELTVAAGESRTVTCQKAMRKCR